MGILFSLIWFGLIIFVIASIWKTFEKAGQPGWASLIPIYNFYIICKISGTKNWWLVFIPLANIYIIIVGYINMAKSFGKDAGFGIGLILLGIIFFPILGFGSAQYIGPNGETALDRDIDNIGN